MKKLLNAVLAAAMVLETFTAVKAAPVPRAADLAQKAAVMADCPVHQSGLYDVTGINDGDDTTGWCSEAHKTSQHTEHWVCLDFGTPVLFDQIRLFWDAEKYPAAYKIQISETARDSDWYDLAHVENCTGGGEKILDTEVSAARYIRVRTLKNVTDDETVRLNTFSVSLNGKGTADETAVQRDSDWLTEDIVRKASRMYPEIANPDLQNVKSTLNLSKTGFASSHIQWSVGYWHFNQRALYSGVMSSNRTELIEPYYDYYMRSMKAQQDYTADRFGFTDGAMKTTESMRWDGYPFKDSQRGTIYENEYVGWIYSTGPEVAESMYNSIPAASPHWSGTIPIWKQPCSSLSSGSVMTKRTECIIWMTPTPWSITGGSIMRPPTMQAPAA